MNANELADKLKLVRCLAGDGQVLNDAEAVLRQFGLAESIIKQQELQIEELKDEVAMWKMSYENNIRMEGGYGLN